MQIEHGSSWHSVVYKDGSRSDTLLFSVWLLTICRIFLWSRQVNKLCLSSIPNLYNVSQDSVTGTAQAQYCTGANIDVPLSFSNRDSFTSLYLSIKTSVSKTPVLFPPHHQDLSPSPLQLKLWHGSETT